jgi:hypothetical protein
MAKNFIFVIFSLIYFCCQQSTDFDDFPNRGKAVVTLENNVYVGSASLSSRTTDEFNFKSINLSLDNSMKIEILSEEFSVGIFSCDHTQSIIFTLISDQESYYSAKEGTLNINKVTSEQIIGEFDIVVHDATASCLECPEALKKTKGKFNAIK